MKPRYYVHMGPKATEKVSCIWKAAHIILSLLLLGSSGTATVCIYNILEMYEFNCVLYSTIQFEQSHNERFKLTTTTSTPTESNATESNVTSSSTPAIEDLEELDCSQSKISVETRTSTRLDQVLLIGPLPVECQMQKLQEIDVMYPTDEANEHELDSEWKKWKKVALKAKQDRNLVYRTWEVNKTGFINMRRTIFATAYMCNLVLFAPLASVVTTIFIGALVGVGGKGGAGNPGDVLPNPWICVYPFLGLCVFMLTFNFVAYYMFHNGLLMFCQNYVKFTHTKVCSEDVDQYNVQFTKNQLGPPKPFYLNYFVGNYAMQVTASLWVIQALVYVFRIMCLADFSLYLTRIQLKSDPKDAKMANVVLTAMDAKSKLV